MVERLLEEDLNIIDVTTFALEIGEKKGKMEFFAREEMVICGLKYVAQIFEERGIEVSFFAKDSQKVQGSARNENTTYGNEWVCTISRMANRRTCC